MPIKTPLDSSESDVRIEIVPLMDVIFCILTFFILAAVTLTRQSAINVDLPRAATGTTQMRKILVVSVDPVGQTYLEKQPIGRDQLYQALLNFQQRSPDGLMVLYASKASSYNDVVQILDLLRSVGGDRVALATLPDAGGTAPQAPIGTGAAPGTVDPLAPYQLPTQTTPANPSQSIPGLEPLPGSTIAPSSKPGAPQTGSTPKKSVVQP
ncbi:MAG TPA: biopolymer transporter ExbD [Trichocoleus sp.]|jgi:biopolymer transport protein ExbD